MFLQAVDHPYLVVHSSSVKDKQAALAVKLADSEPADAVPEPTSPPVAARDMCAICQDQIVATEVTRDTRVHTLLNIDW